MEWQGRLNETRPATFNRETMKKSVLLSLLIICWLCPDAAHAKGKKVQRSSGTYGCARFDINENGVFEPEELEAIRKAFNEGDTALKPIDLNNDGKLDDSELALVQAPKSPKKKAKKKEA